MFSAYWLCTRRNQVRDGTDGSKPFLHLSQDIGDTITNTNRRKVDMYVVGILAGRLVHFKKVIGKSGHKMSGKRFTIVQRNPSIPDHSRKK